MPVLPKPMLQAGFLRVALQILSGITGRAAPFIFISKYWAHDNSHHPSKLPGHVHKPDMGSTYINLTWALRSLILLLARPLMAACRVGSRARSECWSDLLRLSFSLWLG